MGIVPVPDERLDVLTKMYDPEKTTPTTIEFVDIAGLVKGASKGEGLGNKFLSHIREVDAIVHVVRCFEDSNIVHVDGSVSPVRDIETIETELILADMEVMERRVERTRKMLKSGDKKYEIELDIYERILKALEEGNTVRTMHFDLDEKKIVDELFNYIKTCIICRKCVRRRYQLRKSQSSFRRII